MKKLLLLLLFFPSLLQAGGTPTEYIKQNADAVIAILTDPALASPEGKTEKIARIAKLTDTFFDKEELSKRALGQYWRLLSDQQRLEFQDLFLAIIKSVYLKKIDAYNNESVTYNQELLKSETLAEVHTNLVSTNLNANIIYLLIKNNAQQWKVYDVVIENVSLVKNYRTQFQNILQTNTPEQLLTIMREKANEKS